jgi:hypothetical protein
MKQGDLLAISIDTDFSRISPEDTKQDGATNGSEEDVLASRLVTLPLVNAHVRN